MTTKDTAKYKDLFLSEGREHLEAMNKSLLGLEKSPERVEFLNEIFRHTHTLKSMAATMNYDKMARLCHATEDVLDGIKKKKVKLDDVIDLLFECFDTLEISIKQISEDKEEVDSAPLVERLQVLLAGDQGGGTKEKKGKKEVMEAGSTAIDKISSIEVKVERLDTLMNLAEELLINKMRLDKIKGDLDSPELSAAVDALGRLVADLQFNVMQSRMVPVGFVFDRFPRMVRDLAKQQRKEVDLHMEGSDIELDRVMIDEIGESLVHLLRNAVDHGIETPQERKKANKPSGGTIKLTATRTKSSAVIQVSDDGAGLDWEYIKSVGIKRGILSPEATKEEVTDSIFSGLSSTKQVTAVSGRGFGLNIVKNKIESLGGAIRVESEPKKGTTFIIEIPLTLAIIKTLFVQVGGKVYAVPLVSVERLVTVNREDIKGIMDHEAIVLGEEEVLITRLDLLFGMPPSAHKKQPIVIIRKDQEKLGLAVDALMSTEEIVIKPLNRLIRENRYFSGCTIVGSGEVILILDVANLMLSRRVQKTAKEEKENLSMPVTAG